MTSEGRGSSGLLKGRLLGELRPYLLPVVLVFIVSLASIPITLVIPLPIKIIVDNVLGPQALPNYLSILVGSSSLSKTTIVLLAISILLASSVLNYTLGLVDIWWTSKVGNRITLDMRARLFRQLQRLSILYHDTKGVTDSTYRVQNDATWLRQLMVDTLPSMLTSFLTLGGMIVVMTILDWQLAAIALAVSPVILLLTILYRPRLRAGWKKVKTSESAAMSTAQESLSAAREVKAFGQEGRENEQFLTRYTESADAMLKVFLQSGTYNLLIGVITAAGLSAVLYVGVGHVQSGALSLGGLLIVNYYITQIYNPMRDLGRNLLDLQQSFAGMDRFLEVMAEQPDVLEASNARPLARAKGRIAFENVSFGYDKTNRVLQDVSFVLEAGKRLGVVGPTGSGKTTLSSLILRFFDTTTGRVTLDGVDLKEYKVADLRNQYAVVLQDTVLFSTSVAENIRFARPDATTEEIVAAAKAASAHDFIMNLPNGYNTEVGERGMKLSGGERQRISIALAFLKNAPILLLDEPTSALDVKTETSLLNTIQELMKGRTTFMIAHRPSTLRNCDSIIMLENGRIVKETTEVSAVIESMTMTRISSS